MRSLWLLLGLVAFANALSWPSSDASSYITPTTCSGVVFSPPNGGSFNVSVFDPCTKTTQSVFVAVNCPERIPAANFTLLSLAKTGNTIQLEGRVCTERDYIQRWQRTRTPFANNTEGKGTSSVVTDSIVDFGIYQYSWQIFDGCYTYAYNTSVFYDGVNLFVLPPGNYEDSWVENKQCVGDQRQVHLKNGVKEMVYRVDYSSGSGAAQTTDDFRPIWFEAESSVQTGPNNKAPAQTSIKHVWNVRSYDRVLIYKLKGSNYVDYWFAKPEHLPTHNVTFGWSWTQSYSGISGSSVLSPGSKQTSPLRSYPPNRANATFNTGAFTIREAREYEDTVRNTSTVRDRWYWADLKHPMWAKVPLCRIRLEVPSGQGYRTQATAFPFLGNATSSEFSWCTGSYEVTVNASTTQSGCWSTASQSFDVSCGFAPEVFWSESNSHVAAFPHSSGYLDLTVNGYDPLGRPVTLDYVLAKSPEGANPTFSSISTGLRLFPDLPGVYLVNVSASNGCSRSAWMTEYVHVYCPYEAPPAPTFDPLVPASMVFSGTPVDLTLTGSGSSPTLQLPKLQYSIESRTVGGVATAPFADDKYSGYLTTISDSQSRFRPRGAGVYTLAVRAGHGCGQFSPATQQQFELTCENANPFTVPASWTRTETSTSGNLPVHTFDVSEGTAWTAPTAPSASLRIRHTWVLEGTTQHVQAFASYLTPLAPTSAVFAPNRTGTFVFKYYVDDTCSQATATYTLNVVCTDPTVQLTAVSSTPYYAGNQYEFRLDSTYAITREYVFMMDGTTTPLPIVVTGSSVFVYPAEPGTYVITGKGTPACGAPASASLSITVVARPACQPISFNVVAHRRMTGAIATPLDPIAVQFENGQFPQVVLNASLSTFGTTTLSSVTLQGWVVSAPPTSFYANRTAVSTGTQWDYPIFANTPAVGYVAHEDRFESWVETSTKLLVLWENAQKLAVAMHPDVAGSYVVRLVLDNGCTKESREVTVTAGCPAIAPSVVIDNDKGVQVASSTGFAQGQIPGVSLTITAAGNELLVLNASRSSVGGNTGNTGLYYHWYWQSPNNNDHSGLLTPYAPVLLLNPKLYRFNNRPLFVTVSDGCSNVTAAVRVASQCAGPTLALKADRAAIDWRQLQTCDGTFKLDTGMCIDHKGWQVSQGWMPARVTAQSAFHAAFAASSDSDSDKQKLAIGLGVGLGAVGLIAIVALSVIGVKKGWCSRGGGGTTAGKSSTGIEL